MLTSTVPAGRRVYQPVLDARFAVDRSLTPRVGYPFEFTRASEARYWDSAGVLQTAAINAARFDYDPSSLASLGLRNEEQRTNIFSFSSDYNSAGWSRMGTVTVTSDAAVAPDGTQTADRVQLGGIDGDGRVFRYHTLTANQPYTYTLFVKAVSGSGTFLLGSNTGTYSEPTEVSDQEWTRVEYHITRSTDQSVAFYVGYDPRHSSASAADVSDFYAWGAQLEEGASETSPIPTTTAEVTRSGDVTTLSGSGFDAMYRHGEGAVVWEGMMEAGQLHAFPFNFYYGSSTDYLGVYAPGLSGSAFHFRAGATTAGAAVQNADSGFAYGQPAKIAMSWDASGVVGAVNGFSGATNAGAMRTPSALALMRRIHASGSTAAGPFTGYVSRFRYYRDKLPQSRLEELTTP